jgi:hypothetical protein
VDFGFQCELRGSRFERLFGADEFLSLGCRNGCLYRQLAVADVAVTLCSRGIAGGQQRLA